MPERITQFFVSDLFDFVLHAFDFDLDLDLVMHAFFFFSTAVTKSKPSEIL